MTDPVAEAAAQIAAQQAEPTLLEKAMDTIHDLEAKVEHLIHPEAVSVGIESKPSLDSAPVAEGSALVMVEPGNAPVVAVESVTAPATGDAGNVEAAPTSGSSSEAAHATGELPNAAPTPPDGAATAAAGDVPNAVLAVAEPIAEAASAPNADGASITSPTAESSAEPKMIAMDLATDAPLHMKIAQHLESIYTLAKSAPAAAVADTSALKTHVGDILHRISNGMSVTEGELVTKLEALYRML